MPHRVDGSQCVGGGHVWPCPLDRPNGDLGLAQMILTGSPSVGQRVVDDVLKVGVHAAMRARMEAKEKLSRVFLPPARPLTGSLAWPRA